MRKRLKVLLFSRGRGHGHALTDMYLLKALKERHHNIDCTVCSYGTGAATFKKFRHQVRDLGIGDENLFTETLLLALTVIKECKPDVIVAHEEFAALMAAAVCKVPSLYTSAWFPPLGTLAAELVESASSIVIRGDAGLFPVPERVKVAPVYLGPILRELKFSRAKDRHTIRRKYNISTDGFVASVITGGWFDDEKYPLADIVCNAFRRISTRDKHLFWFSSRDRQEMDNRFGGFKNIVPLDYTSRVERFYCASDLVITKGTFNSTAEAGFLGVPSIAILSGQNPIDDILVPRLPNNRSFYAGATTEDLLVKEFERVAGSDKGCYSCLPLEVKPISWAADTLAAELMRIGG